VLKHLGTFQDGGLRHNNPLSVALWESKFLWPTKGMPDFALSLGTGTSSSASVAAKQGPLSPVRDRFVSRLFRTFMSSMDGGKAWSELINTISADSRERFHRLNLTLTCHEPSIDDVFDDRLSYKPSHPIYSYRRPSSCHPRPDVRGNVLLRA